MGGDSSDNSKDSFKGKAKIIILIGKKRQKIHEEINADFQKKIQRIKMDKKKLEDRKKIIEEDIMKKEIEKEIIENEIRKKEKEEKNCKDQEDSLLKIKEVIDSWEKNYIQNLMEAATENLEEEKNSL
jgi:hypothetical protein